MGRFSPSTQPIQSWTQGLSEGMGDLAQSLIQRRQFNLQKQRQTFDQNIQTQNEARENAQAGYTPAQPYGASTANTPEGLDRISNAGVSDAGTPASYDPTKSAGYAIWQPRLQNSLDKANIMAGARLGAAKIGADSRIDVTHLRYGSMVPDENGNMIYQPGVQVEGQEAVKKEGLDFQQGWHDQLSNQFSRKLGETTRHDQAMEARPVGGSNKMSIGGGGGSPATGPEQTFIRNRQAALQKPQQVPGRLNADGSSFTVRHTPGLPPAGAFQEAKHEANLTRMGAGVTDTIPDAPAARASGKVNPDSAAGVERNGTAASLTPAPTHGAQTPVHPGTNKSQQELPATSQGIPASPTSDNKPAARAPLDGRSKLMAKSNPQYKASLISRGYKEGTDF